MAEERGKLDYENVGVSRAAKEKGLEALLSWIEKSFDYHSTVRPILKIGAYANVIPLPPPFGDRTGVAISTDGVGTKILVAQMLDRYDTIGIDLVAMNANDVLCVGADPLALVDSISVEQCHPRLLEEIGKGLSLGARQAGISIPGGEIAQVREMVRGVREGYGFDLVGTCIGVVELDRIIVGQSIEEGDVLLGLPSSGIHSNGLTLARDVFFNRLGWKVDRYVAEFGRTLGEELLEPTRIYVRAVRGLLGEPSLPVKGLFHITGDGFLNLARAEKAVGFVIDRLPDPPPVFQWIQDLGNLSDEEMYRVFNMGVGFALVVPGREVERVNALLASLGEPSAMPLGYAVSDEEKKIVIRPKGLVSRGNRFEKF
jgi:phosphoribosylformylglycinamidine cyclo-ligase